MDIVMVFLLMSGVLWVGYLLRGWHDGPSRAARDAMTQMIRESTEARIRAQRKF